jgi:hypothetical protein
MWNIFKKEISKEVITEDQIGITLNKYNNLIYIKEQLQHRIKLIEKSLDKDEMNSDFQVDFLLHTGDYYHNGNWELQKTYINERDPQSIYKLTTKENIKIKNFLLEFWKNKIEEINSQIKNFYLVEL